MDPVDGFVTRPTEHDASTGNGMSMADDTYSRSYRSPDPYRRPASAGEQAGGSDPLAELARLIGQSDPFAELGRSPRQAQPAPHASPSTAPDWQAAHEQHFAATRPPARDPYPASDDHGYPLAPPEAYAEDHRQYGQHYDDVAARADDQFHTAADDHRGAYAAAHGHGHAAAPADHDAEHFYQDDGPLEPHEEEMYDDAPRARRHGGLVTALALIGCAMLGTAGAYAYRSYSATPGTKEPVPVITADTATPTKVVPTTAIDPQSSKAMDRLATAVSGEQLVRRQEEPVALRELGTAAAPRVVLPAPTTPAAATPNPPSQPSTAAPGSGEPKRVRTVTIRPDGNDLSGRPVGAPPPAPRAAANPAANPTTATTTPPAPRAAAPARSGGPISLDPQGAPAETATVPPPARTRTAVAPPPQAAPPETASASAGGYLVQLSSQRSEGEAQSSYRALQTKFPNELGSRPPVIRRADLGSKGVYYRTMVGPFRSAQEASQFCASYKAAGGQCVVPSN
jgi:hypothetical protein